MSDPLGIVVELAPDRVLAGLARIDSGLAQSEAKGRAAGASLEDAFAKAAAGALAAVERSAKAQEAALARAAREAAKAAREAQREIEDAARATVASAERRARERAAADRAAAKAAADAARTAAAAQERAAQQAATAAKAAADQQRAAQDRLRNSYREIVGPAAQFGERIAQANALMRQGAINTQQYAAYVSRLRGEIKGFNPGAPGGGGGGGISGALGSILPGPLAAIAAPAAAVGATVALGRQALELSDSYQVLSNKIKVVTESEAEAARVREKLFDIADRTRNSNESVVTVYTRMAASAKELGRSESELLRFTESLSKAVKISGATAQEAQAGLIQLAQGVGSGALRGDELRSVLEQLPAVADVIAKGLGVTRAQLRQLGADGKITADVIFDAFEKARGSIDERFGKSVATVADLQQVLHNQIERTVGALVEQTGILPALASGFAAVGKVIRDMAESLGVAIDLTKTYFAAFPSWFKDLAVGPLLGTAKGREGLLAGALPITQIKNVATKGFGGIFTNFADNLNRTQVAKEADSLGLDTSGTVEEMKEATARAEIAQAQARKFLETDSGAQERTIAMFGRWKDGILSVAEGTKTFEEIEEEERKAAEKAAQAHEKAARAHEQLARQYQQLEAGLSAAYRAGLQLAATEETLDKAVRAGITTRDRANQVMQETRERLRDQLEPFDAAIKKVREETAALGLTAEERKRANDIRAIENNLRAQGVKLTADEILQLEAALDAQQAATKAAEDRQRALTNQRAVYDQVYGAGTRYREMLAAWTAEYERGTVSANRYAFEVGKLQDEYNKAVGGSSLTETFTRQAEKAAKDNQAAIDGLATSLAKVGIGLFDLAETADRSFTEIAASAAAAAARIAVEFAILQGLKSVFGGDSGIVSAASKVFFGGNRAAGGTYVTPNGGGGGTDSVPVLFRTTPGERITFTPPGQAAPAQAAPQVVVPVNVHNGIHPDMIAAALDTPSGHAAVWNVIERFADQLATRVRSSS